MLFAFEFILHFKKLIFLGPPSQCAGTYGNVLGPTSIQIYWTDGSSNGRPITSYIVESQNINDKQWVSAKYGMCAVDI